MNKILCVLSMYLFVWLQGVSQTPTAPTVTCPANPIVYVNENCAATLQFSGATATGFPVPAITYDTYYGSFSEGQTLLVGGPGTIVVTVNATNSVGTASCTYLIVVIDNTAPVINCSNITVSADPGSCSKTITGYGVSATDNCYLQNLFWNLETFSVGTTTQTFTAIDASGNIAVCSRTVTVSDNEPPVISNCQNITANAYLTCDQVVNYSPVATDNCPGVTVHTSTPSGSSFSVGNTTVNVVATDASGNTATCSFVVTVFDKGIPHTTCITEEQDLILDEHCEAVLPDYRNLITGEDNCPGEVVITQDPAPGTIINHHGELQVKFIPRDAAGNTETKYVCYLQVNVIDNIPPVITQCPANITVDALPEQCTATIPVRDLGHPTMRDNCTFKYFGVTPMGVPADNVYPVGNTTITWVVSDEADNTATCSQVVTVRHNPPPTISDLRASVSTLAPPNHQMRDVTINYTLTGNCNMPATLNVTSNEPVNGTGDGDTEPDWVVVDDHHVKLRAERAANGDGRIYTITVLATDGGGSTTASSVEVRVAHDIRGPVTGHPFRVGSTVDFNGVFWDKPTNKHSAKWLIDDNTAVKGAVIEPTSNKNGKVTGAYKFTDPGVYKLQMNVIDQNNVTTYTSTNGDVEEIVVIYDPNGGYAYGGGWFSSPAGALKSNPALTAKVSYGFAINYFKGATLPKGETQFELKVGDFEYNAVNFDYLSISGAKAQFKGTGKIIGGQSGINFIMTIIDGDLDGTGIDKVRMKIYNKNTGQVYYDNQAGASDAADPTTAVGLNSSIVVQNTTNTVTRAEASEKVIEVVNELGVTAIPNPTANNFVLTIRSDNRNDKIVMQVLDVYGRVIQTNNVVADQTIKLGDKYRPGIYFVKLIQGKNYKQLKLVKVPN